MKSPPTNAAHAAHVATSREGAQDGDTEALRPEERDTARPVDQELVEPGPVLSKRMIMCLHNDELNN